MDSHPQRLTPVVTVGPAGPSQVDDPELGVLCCREALWLVRAINDQGGTAERLRGQGHPHLLRGDLDPARRCQPEARAVSVVVGDRDGETWAHCALGEVAPAQVSTFGREAVCQLHDRVTAPQLV